MRLVLFGDLHLDTKFRWMRAEVARRRRQALRDTLVRILELADEVDADAILCAGDLYEQERFTADTRRFLERTLGATHRKVFLAPGNHDWFGRQSVYAQVTWPSNVHVFREDRLTCVELTPGLRLWGAGFTTPTRPTGFFETGFQAEGGGTKLALFHGAERSGLPFEAEGKAAHAPFDASDIERAGLDHAFVGHYHRPRDADRFTYPGNPDPLSFGEDGERGAVVIHLDGEGALRRERHVVAQSAVHDLVFDVSGCDHLDEIRNGVARLLEGLSGTARLTVTGEVHPDVELPLESLAEVEHGLDDLVLRQRKLHVGYELEAIREEPTVRGRFVQDVLATADLDDEQQRRILTTGLRALDGRDDLEVK
jgi:DNA repair exonuclease SbcCD nuclease subunit